MRIRDGLVLHPFLLAAFPILYLWAQNIEFAVSFPDVLPSLLVVLAATGGLFVVAWLAIRRDAARAGVVTSIVVLLTLTYGLVYRGLESRLPFRVQHRFLLPLLILLAAAGIAATVRGSWNPGVLSRGLNLVALTLVVVNLASAVWFTARSSGAGAVPASPFPDPPAGATDVGRDIYYVILDRYGSDRVLRRHLGFDNSAFTQSLRDRGFYVADLSRANYPRTAHSVAASLNMRYLDRLLDVGRAAPGDWGPVYRLLRRHEVGRLLTAGGYRYVHIGSWWTPTADNPMADVTMRFGALSEFSQVVFDSSVLSPFGELLFGRESGRTEYERVRWQFAALEAAGRITGPKFVLAHILSPHEPFVFDERGGFVGPARRARTDRRTLYRNQVRYLNRLIVGFLDRILAGPEQGRPIVILQADEGPFEAPGRWAGKPSSLLERKFGILNAYHVPGIREGELYPTITPVNSFRIVLNRVLGMDLPLLPDRSIVWRDAKHLYDFTEVTERLPRPDGASTTTP